MIVYIGCADTHTIIVVFCTFKVNGGGSGGVWIREYRLREYSGHTLYQLTCAMCMTSSVILR